LVLGGILLLAPSGGYHAFNGLPLNTGPEFGLFLLILPFLVWTSLRRLWYRFLSRLSTPALPLLGVAVLLALGLKGLLFFSETRQGFPACYHPLDEAPVSSICEKSYTNPWHRFGATRVDHTIDFGPSDWNLSFMNSLRFNYYQRGEPSRDRLPFGVTWHGEFETDPDDTIQLMYLGEALLQLDGRTVQLPRQYADLETLTIPVSAGVHRFVLSYQFDSGARVGDDIRFVPGPELHLLTGVDQGRSRAALGTAPGPGWLVLGALVDLVLIAFALSLAAVYVLLLRVRGALLLVVCLVAPWLSEMLPTWFLAGQSVYFLAAATVLVVTLLIGRRQHHRRLLIAYCGAALLVASDTFRVYRDLSAVVLRPGGSDWLAYESYARTVLETWSLQGGRDVFYYQPLFRYIRFAEHLLLGDGDALIVILARLGLHVGILWMCWLFRPRRMSWSVSQVFAGAAPVLLMWLINTEGVVGLIRSGASEYPTWIFFFFALNLLWGPGRSRGHVVGCALLGLTAAVRANQAPALIWMGVCYIVGARRKGPRHLLWVTAAAASFGLLPLAHNLYYGGELILLSTEHTLPGFLVLELRQLPSLAWDPATRALLLQQLEGLLYFGPAPDLPTSVGGGLSLVIRGLQIAWVMSVVTAVTRAVRGRAVNWFLLLVPVLYIGTQIPFRVINYYPRHIVIAYVAMGAVTFAALCRQESIERGGLRIVE
jgi:hypothetical protein